MYDLALAMVTYLNDHSGGSTALVSVCVLDDAAGVARVRDYVRGNRIGNYSTSDWEDAMGVAWCASVKYGEGSVTSFENFDWEKPYPNQATPTTTIN